jgi:hypothetical protein
MLRRTSVELRLSAVHDATSAARANVAAPLLNLYSREVYAEFVSPSP